MNKTEALYQFYSSFGIPAYEENSVPNDAKMPYIAYEIVTDSLSDHTTSITAQLWYKSNSWVECNAMAEKISEALQGGCKHKVNNGHIILYRGTPFATNIPNSDDTTVKHKNINIECDYVTIF